MSDMTHSPAGSSQPADTEARPDAPSRRSASVRALLAATAVCAVFLAAALPLIATGYDGARHKTRGAMDEGARHKTRGAIDQDVFHLPVVRAFARQWPHFDFSDYLSATTPGYHVILAAVNRWISDDPRVLRAAGMLFTLGLLATLASAAAWRTTAFAAVVVSLPMLASLYIFSSGVWLLPDNIAWWAVLAILLLCLRPRVDRWTYICGGAVLLAAVLVRQSSLWAAAPLCFSAWLGPSERAWPTTIAGNPMASRQLLASRDTLALRSARSAAMIAAILPAVIVLGLFFRMWHGTVPPTFQRPHPGISPIVSGHNPATPAAVLAEFGFVAAFFSGFLVTRLRTELDTRPRQWMIVAGLIIGVLAGAIPKTSWNDRAGRYSGLWTIARHLPTAHDRSPFIIGLCGLGGGLLVAWLLTQKGRDRWLWLAAWAAFFAAQCAGALPWQRYYEGFVVMSLVTMAVSRPFSRLALVGPGVLTIFWAVVTVMSVR